MANQELKIALTQDQLDRIRDLCRKIVESEHRIRAWDIEIGDIVRAASKGDN